MTTYVNARKTEYVIELVDRPAPKDRNGFFMEPLFSFEIDTAIEALARVDEILCG